MSDRVSDEVLADISKALESGARYHIVGGDMVRFEARAIVREVMEDRARVADVALTDAERQHLADIMEQTRLEWCDEAVEALRKVYAAAGVEIPAELRTVYP